MSLCKHFIISNSTFHWWGAWLSLNKNKIIVAPDPWINSYTMNEVVPENWNKISCNRSELFDRANNKIFELKNENALLGKNQKIQFNSINNLDKYYCSDNIIKLTIDSSDRGILKVNNDKKNLYL